jgi:hypothetical protein
MGPAAAAILQRAHNTTCGYNGSRLINLSRSLGARHPSPHSPYVVLSWCAGGQGPKSWITSLMGVCVCVCEKGGR